jgi:hypothetical protein
MPSFSGLSVNSDNLPFSYVILFLYSLMSAICMKLDTDIHIDLHLVFFGKTCVTHVVRSSPSHAPVPSSPSPAHGLAITTTQVLNVNSGWSDSLNLADQEAAAFRLGNKISQKKKKNGTRGRWALQWKVGSSKNIVVNVNNISHKSNIFRAIFWL